MSHYYYYYYYYYYYISCLYDEINYSRYLLLADDIKIYRAIKSPKDFDLLQSDIDSV
jgi:hypothetical protein